MADIRNAVSDDLEIIQAIARDAYAIYRPRIGREPAPMVADFAAQIADGIVDVCDIDGTVTGFVVFYPRDDHMHLENVAVCGHAQGTGTGSRLISHVEDTARAHGLRSVELYTNEKMTENVPYYLKRGYEEIDRREEDGFKRIFFRKTL